MDFQLWPRKNESISISLGPKEISYMHNIEGCFYKSILSTIQLVTKTNLSLLRLNRISFDITSYWISNVPKDFWIWQNSILSCSIVRSYPQSVPGKTLCVQSPRMQYYLIVVFRRKIEYDWFIISNSRSYY